MRPFEWLLAALTLSGSLALLLLRQRPPAVVWLFCTCAVLVLALHLRQEDLHWQLFPLYAAVILVIFLLLRPSPSRALAMLPLSLTAISLALAWLLPLFHLPSPTGQYAVGTRTLFLTDATSGRELVVQLWYPAEPLGPLAPYTRPAEAKPLFRYQALIPTHSHQDAPFAAPPAGRSGRLPILLFGHMWGGRRTQDTFLTEDLASHGYLVAAVDHPGNSALVELKDGRVIRGTMADALSTRRQSPAQIVAVWNRELAVWTRDNRFVLATLLNLGQDPASPLFHRLDGQRIGAFGHSFGGAASVALLGPETSKEEPHVTSAVNLDGWTFAGLKQRTTQPILLLYSFDASSPVAPMTGRDADEQLERYDRSLVNANLARFGGYKAFLLGTQHLDFTDQTLVSPLHHFTYTGPIAGARIREITRATVLAFFDQTLRGEGALPAYPELQWMRGTHTRIAP